MERRKRRARRLRRRRAERRAFLGMFFLCLLAAGVFAFYIVGKGEGSSGDFGKAALILTEPKADEISKNLKDTTIYLKPGQTVVKDPTLTLKKGSKTSYIRARLLYGGLDALKREELEEGLELLEGWVKNPEDGYYYYQYPLKAGESVCFFRSLTIPESWEKVPEHVCFCFEVDAETAEAEKVELVRDQKQKIVEWHKKRETT